MKKLSGVLLGLSLFLGMACVATAQENAQQMGHKPPKVLTLTREFIKPGKNGNAHDKTESLFVNAMSAAKWPTHYLAMDSITGKPRSLFLTGYESFEAWQNDYIAETKNTTLSEALDHANEADGALLDSTENSALVYREDQSFNAEVDMPHMRMFEFEVFVIRPGHEKEWDDAVKLVLDAYKKNIPDAHWAMYQEMFGMPGGEYIVITPLKSAAEIDKAFADGPKFMAAMGEDGMKKLSELSAAAIESSETNLFAINPRISYVSAETMAADPTFWKPARVATPAAEHKKPAEKPAQ